MARLLYPVRDLAGDRIVVTAGPTREPIDPVRYISNRSSGKMGYRLAAAALRRGAAVTLVSGPTSIAPPAGAVFVPVETTEEMREAVLHHSQGATVVIKAAAVADYRVKDPAATKIKGKQDLTLFLTTNPDILREVAAARPGAFMVGFAAETHDVAANAQVKLESKGIDLLVANDVSQAGIGFDAEDNEVLLLDRWGGRRALPRMPKGEVADAILSHVLALRATVPTGQAGERSRRKRDVGGRLGRTRGDLATLSRSWANGASPRGGCATRPRRSAPGAGAQPTRMLPLQALRRPIHHRLRLR